ncbi:phosphatidylinositol phosphate synthase [Actinokineospora globicatena]|uniref:Phosphatidylinositol phosphate synthase n=1 Tax=Actinokineospora globicatena TaxID=103729 RepID=A0A9W6V9K4_9PSEU|nr:CDP-alcohol phosphatidyltransferase family protein [Actinokineospora globicatena]MCP2304179.1 CDP-diacylglycerol--glycerol-3-phosphate 3-phosphatidyltransferase [Actinokineospora globicatena]GLW78463.1 CDP-diacylglycerol--glycerol-3-phosphate 3-phosphatidyltransferase [Actinokineospora globicatena]GLW84873.1 CDP-diacylglycerol--glycerol-3-phosphate 3-phosphatidyltransferase [Actinokineospora globicatena]GLW91068.1 CDP-diacylglycerol--glycerol-3-phosphate 3-phosphatidyltransferase [Actinokine
MLNIFARASVSRVTDPIGAGLVRLGLTPNAVTVLGTAGAIAGALWLFPTGQLLAGTFVVWGFAMFDLLDGAMARALGGGTRYGAVLDATCDRLADGALLCGITWYLFDTGDRVTAVAALICLVLGQVVSYIKARAEASGLDADGGLVERAERLIITLVGTGLAGLGVPYAVAVGLWVVAAGSVITVGQRLLAVRRSAAQPAGEKAHELG